MSSAPVNPGLTDVLNILSNSASPALSSLLSSPKVQTALQHASPADLVQLSDQALQLQTVDSLFGTSDTGASSPVADQLGGYQGQLEALLGTSNSVNLLG